MKTLYFDCGMGAAGDMITAALLELMPDSNEMISTLNAIGIPGVVYKSEESVKCGVKGTHVVVTVNGYEEKSGCDHGKSDHEHEHLHDAQAHHHSGMHEINHIIEELSLPEKVKADVLSVYGVIAEAESYAHGAPVSEIHFHEVGSMDAIADIAAVCLMMKKLAPKRVVVSPVHVGCGSVRCAHGVLSVPAPATAFILRNVPVYGGKIKGELCTPTGAALLKYFANSFGEMPIMNVEKIGHGMGHNDFEIANCVRVVFGEEK